MVAKAIKPSIPAAVKTTKKIVTAVKPAANVDDTSRYGTGRRKNAIARVWVKPGSGKIMVNGKLITEYFTRPVLRMIITQPFDATKTISQMDVVLYS